LNKLSKKAVRNITITTCGVFAVIFLISGIFFYLVTGPVSTAGWGVDRITATSELTASLDSKIDELREDIESASSGDEFVLEITQEEATSKIDQLARQGNISIDTDHPQVYFSPGMICASAKIHFVLGIETSVQIEIKTKDGKPDFTIKRLDFGRLILPKTLINNVMTAFEHELGKRWDELAVTVEEIDIEPGIMTVTMVKK
jgi:nucleotidyltransferase/DNA polymerase involved in DNA repair